MEESILDIKLTNRPRIGDSNVENQTDGGRLDDRAESLVIVDAWTLGLTTDHRSKSVVDDGEIQPIHRAEDAIRSGS